MQSRIDQKIIISAFFILLLSLLIYSCSDSESSMSEVKTISNYDGLFHVSILANNTEEVYFGIENKNKKRLKNNS